MSETRNLKFDVSRWIEEQPTCPTRKQTVARFPHVPQKAIRAALQAREDRELLEARAAKGS